MVVVFWINGLGRLYNVVLKIINGDIEVSGVGDEVIGCIGYDKCDGVIIWICICMCWIDLV